MEQEFYRKRLEKNGIQVLIPNEKDREIVHEIIFKELCLGIIKQKSKLECKRIIEELVLVGARSIIFSNSKYNTLFT